jgi:enterochelin esterase family protein
MVVDAGRRVSESLFLGDSLGELTGKFAAGVDFVAVKAPEDLNDQQWSGVALCVMSSGYAKRAGASEAAPAGSPMGSPSFMREAQIQTAAFEDDLIQVVIPMIDSTYRTIPDRDHRAMAGLSMGGMQTFQITTNHLDTFSYIGGLSGAGTGFVSGNNTFDAKTAFNGVFADPAAFNKKVHLLWLGVGTAEPERMHTGIIAFHEALVKAGIDVKFYESQGTAHEWQTWRRDLNLFAPLLFQKQAK